MLSRVRALASLNAPRLLLIALLLAACASDPDAAATTTCPWYRQCGVVDGVSCGSCDDGDPCTVDACVDGRCTVVTVSDACRCTATCPPEDALRPVQTVQQGDGGVAGLETIRGLAVSADGRDTYVVAQGVTLVRDGVVAASWALEPAPVGPPSSVAVVAERVVAVGTPGRLYLLARAAETGALTPLGSLERPVTGLAARGNTLVALDGQGLWVLDLSTPAAPRAAAARAIPETAGARAVVTTGRLALVAGFEASAVVAVDLDAPDLPVVGRASGSPGLARPDALALLDGAHVAVGGFCDNAVAVLGVAPEGALTWLAAMTPEGPFVATGPATSCPTAESPDAFIHPGALATLDGEHLLVMTGARRYFAAEWLRWDGAALTRTGAVAEQPATFDGSGMDYITDPTPAPVPFDPMKLRGLVSAAASPAGVVAASAISNAVAVVSPQGAGPFLRRGAGGADGLTCVAGLAASPDGADVYTASRCIPAIGRLRVDAERGTLTPATPTPVPDAEPYDLVAAVALPNDETLAAVTASPTSTVAGRVHTFARSSDGLRAEAQVALGDCDGKRAFPVGLLAVGQDLYVADFQREGASCIHHVRETQDGLALAEGVVSADVGGIESFAMSRDGRFVYAACYVAEAVTALARDADTGALTVLERFSLPETRGAEFVALSPDERHVYVSSPVESTLVVWARDTTLGTLSYVQTVRADDTHLLRDAAGLAVSPEGDRVYLSARGSDAVTVFSRDPSDGQVSLRQTLTDLYDWPNAVLAAPDGRHVYVAGVKSSSVTVLRRDAGGDGCLGVCP